MGLEVNSNDSNDSNLLLSVQRRLFFSATFLVLGLCSFAGGWTLETGISGAVSVDRTGGRQAEVGNNIVTVALLCTELQQ